MDRPDGDGHLLVQHPAEFRLGGGQWLGDLGQQCGLIPGERRIARDQLVQMFEVILDPFRRHHFSDQEVGTRQHPAPETDIAGDGLRPLPVPAVGDSKRSVDHG